MESDRHIEKILRAAAKKRGEQAGGPFELDPVARQELLREASRRGAEKTGGGFFARFFSSFGPRLALAFSVVVIVVIGVWLARPLLSGKQEAATLSMASLKGERHATQNTAASAPAPQSAAPTVATAEPAPGAGAETTAPAIAARRSSAEGAANAQALAENSASVAVNTTASNEAEGNRKQTPAAQSARPVGAIRPNLVLRDSFKSPVAVAPPTPSSAPAGTYQKTRAVNSLAGANIADKVSNSTAPSYATNAIAPSMTIAAADREAQKKSSVAGTSASLNSSQLAKFDAANNQAGEKPGPVSQRFNRVIAVPAVHQRGFGGAGGAVATPLLASFRMEQNGQEIRVVDADGSVYTGSWQLAHEQNAPPAAGARAGGWHFSSGAIPAARSVRPMPAAAMNDDLQAVQNFSFSVTGTNRNLNERITFTGNFIALTNASSTANNASAVGGLFDGRNTTPSNAAPPVVFNSRIAGRIIIGGREIEVNANPAP